MTRAWVTNWVPKDDLVVYVLRDAGGCVLYVGRTQRPKMRLLEHLRQPGKAAAVWSVQLMWCRGLREMMTLERKLIHELRPMHNRGGGHEPWGWS